MDRIVPRPEELSFFSSESGYGSDLRFCRACKKLLDNEKYARAILVGLFRLNLVALGRKDAHAVADKFEEALREKAQRANKSR